MKTKLSLACLLALTATFVSAQKKIQPVDTAHYRPGVGVDIGKTSFRGLCVVDDKVIWASGSRGTLARSTDGGLHFDLMQLGGYEKSDFRDIEAFDSMHAVVMSSGTPALVLVTDDGGKTWAETFRNTDTAWFLDAMDFWTSNNGVIVGDPIDGYFVLLETTDGGKTWQQWEAAKMPAAHPGEALFAASGTSLICMNEEGRALAFVTGGSKARLIGTNIDRKPLKWRLTDLNIQSGSPSQGAYSIGRSDYLMLVVGGDYKCDSCVKHNSVVVSADPFKDKSDVKGYRSCVSPVTDFVFVACGTSGVDLYKNEKWKRLSRDSYNVVKRAKKGKAVFFAGNKGRIGKLM